MVPGYIPKYPDSLALKINAQIVSQIGNFDNFSVKHSITREDTIKMMNEFIQLSLESAVFEDQVRSGVRMDALAHKLKIGFASLKALCGQSI